MKIKTKVDLYPALWVIVWDVFFTVLYQPKEYWKGNLQMANEGNPIGYGCMITNQYGLFYLTILWIIIVILFAKKLPFYLSKTFLLFVFIAHNIGIANWLLLKNHFILALVFILLNATCFYRKTLISELNIKINRFKKSKL